MRARSQHLGAPAIGEEQDRDRTAAHAALIIVERPGLSRRCRRYGEAAAAALPFDEPSIGVGRRVESDLRMGDAEVATGLCEPARVFCLGNDPGTIAIDSKMPCQRIDDFGPILESAAIDDADRRFVRGERLEPFDEHAGLEALLNAACRHVGGAERPRIEIVEEIGDERTKA